MVVRRITHEPESTPRLKRLNLILLLPMITAAGILHIALDAQNWWQALVLACGVTAGIVGFVWWAGGRLMMVAVPCLLVAGAVWVFGVLVADSSAAHIGLLIVGPLVIPELKRLRFTAAAGLVIFVAAVGSAKLWGSPDDLRSDLIGFVVLPAVIMAVVIGLRFPNQTFYDVVRDLEESREREAEMAVMRERVRFAGDLHDIQGHTLHVVKLKVALAQRVLRVDPAGAEDQLREIHELVTDTIGKTTALAYGQRRLNLEVEIANATNLLEASGAEVIISRDGEASSGWSDTLSQVLRETTTNILRHSRARHVHIGLGSTGLAISNDGANETRIPELRGLASLRDKVAQSGGVLDVRQDGENFRTAVTLGRDDIGRDQPPSTDVPSERSRR
ncbi:sensor histidine kinase [Aeromicrobium sp. CF3.5]|uniref:sensor histidine kinase n=1 Tax=Aeromicrobium sp. CF3.5 TaxID=3373078 RepID=UPI003EE5BDC8